MFIFSQFKLPDNYQAKEEYKILKIRFRVVLGKTKDELWSLKKIIMLRMWFLEAYYRYMVIRSNKTPFEFTIDDFPLMSWNDLFTLVKIIGDIDNYQFQYKATYIIRYGYIKNFVDWYFSSLSLTDLKFATSFKKKSKNSKSELREDVNVNDYVDGEILLKPKGMVFQMKNMKEGGKKKYFFNSILISKRCIQMWILPAFFS